jgi:hypothetical protein
MVAEAGNDQRRKLDRAPAGRRLRQSREKRSTVGLGQRGDHPHSAGVEVNISAGERGQLAPPEAGEGCQQHQRLIPGADGLWNGELRLWDNEILMGWYAANEGSIRSKGTMYFVLHPHGLNMSGRWVGLGYDGRIMTGWAAVGQTQEEAEDTMQKLIASEGVPYVDD